MSVGKGGGKIRKDEAAAVEGWVRAGQTRPPNVLRAEEPFFQTHTHTTETEAFSLASRLARSMPINMKHAHTHTPSPDNTRWNQMERNAFYLANKRFHCCSNTSGSIRVHAMVSQIVSTGHNRPATGNTDLKWRAAGNPPSCCLDPYSWNPL